MSAGEKVALAPEPLSSLGIPLDRLFRAEGGGKLLVAILVRLGINRPAFAAGWHRVEEEEIDHPSRMGHSVCADRVALGRWLRPSGDGRTSVVRYPDCYPSPISSLSPCL